MGCDEQAKKWVGWIVESQGFELFMTTVAVINTVCIIYEADLEARCHPAYTEQITRCPSYGGKNVRWLMPVSLGTLAVYTIESTMRLFAQRMRFHKTSWNVLDVSIVLTGWMGEGMNFILGKSVPSFGFVRVFRVLKLMRVLRVFAGFHELQILLMSFVSTLNTIMWGSVMLSVILMIFSILAVDFVHPISVGMDFPTCDRCHRGYASVSESTLTFFQQIVAGDSWGQISVPVMEEQPLTAFLFFAVLLIVSLGTMNLITAIIVKRADQAHEADVLQRSKDKKVVYADKQQELLQLCKEMDTDLDGMITLRELQDAYDNSADFQSIIVNMDIQKDELHYIFSIVDADKSGDVGYEEFVQQVYLLCSRDQRTTLILLKLDVFKLREELKTIAEHVQQEARPGEDKGWSKVAEALNEHGQTLRKHTVLLQSLGTTADRSTAGSECTPGGAPQQAKPFNPERLALPASPHTSQTVSANIDSLGKYAKELAAIEGSILRRVEGHATTLSKHAGMLASLSTAVQYAMPGAGALAADSAGSAFAKPEVERAGVIVERLCRSMREDLSGLLQEVEVKLESSAAILGKNSDLLISLLSDQGCDSSAQLKAKGGRSLLLNEQGRSQETSWSHCMTHDDPNAWRTTDHDEMHSPQPVRPPDTPGLWLCSASKAPPGSDDNTRILIQ